MSNQNFYEKLDLTYIEIGYNMKDIDRTNPGSVPFSIPILTPQIDTSSMKTSNIVQRDKSNIQNTTVANVEVSDLEISNYIYITVPKELCTSPNGEYSVSGKLNISGKMTENDGAYSHTVNNGNIRIIGSVSEINGTVNGIYTASGSLTASGTNSFTTNNATVSGNLNLAPIDRYIPKGSKWAICFIGGDINMPAVLSRLP